MFLGKAVLKICSKFSGERPCRSAISIKLLSNFIEIALRHGCSPVNLLHICSMIFTTPFPRNNYGRLLLKSSLSMFLQFYTRIYKLLFVKVFLGSLLLFVAFSKFPNILKGRIHCEILIQRYLNDVS